MAVLLVDVAKGALAATLGLLVGDHTLGVAAGTAAAIGHLAPVTRGFRGGKGVATGAGMAAVCYPGLSLILGLGFALAVVLTRRVSVGSLLLALLLPIGVAAGGYPGTEILVTGLLSTAVIARHHENIRRLRRGEEPAVRSAPRKATT